MPRIWACIREDIAEPAGSSADRVILSPLDSRRIDNPISLAFMFNDRNVRLDIDCMFMLSLLPYIHIHKNPPL